MSKLDYGATLSDLLILLPQMWIDDLCARKAVSRSQRVEARDLEPRARRVPLAHERGVERCVCVATVEASE